MASKGYLITFEGIDGCGKSTQVELVSEHLTKHKIKHIVTREPGGTIIAEKIRTLILSPINGEMVNSCELLLYLAARAQHVQEKIIPAIKDGIVVLCDRYQEATFAYQGFGRGFSLDKLQELNQFATGSIVPDRTYLFDISVQTAFLRLANAGKEPDRLENNSQEFYQKIRDGYLALARTNTNRIMTIPAKKNRNTIFTLISNDLSSFMTL